MVFESRQTVCPRIETLQNALQYVLERSGTLLIVALECFKHFKNRTLQDPLLLECFIIHLNTSNRSIRRLTAIKVRKHTQQCSFSPAERFKYLVLLREMSTNFIYTEQLKYPEAKQFALTYLTIQTLSHKQKKTHLLKFNLQFVKRWFPGLVLWTPNSTTPPTQPSAQRRVPLRDLHCRSACGLSGRRPSLW